MRFNEILSRSVYLMPILIVLIIIYYLQRIGVNLDSLHDEGFLFLYLNSGSAIGTSQWNLILNFFLGEKICSDILLLRYSRLVLKIITITIFTVSSSYFLIKKKILTNINRVILFVFVSFLYGSMTMGGIILSYNGLQEFFLIIILSLFFISLVQTKFKYRLILYFLIGFVSFLSIMTILPSGILSLFALIILIFAYYFKKSQQKLLLSYLAIALGFVSSILYFHIFIYNLFEIYESMKITASTITSVNRGYDPFSFIVKLLLFFRDFYFVIAFISGSILLYLILRHNLKQFWLAALFLLFSIILYFTYQVKPNISLGMVSSIGIIGFTIIIIRQKSISEIKKHLNFDLFLYLYLFFIPIVFSIGTNVYLGSKMAHFILPWGVVLTVLMYNKNIVKDKLFDRAVFYLITVVMLLLPYLSVFKTTKQENHYFTMEKPISKIKLTKEQKNYFDNCYKIIKDYGFMSQKSVVFSTQLDAMTICAFDAIPAGIFFQPSDFNTFASKENLPIPDFLFLTEYDLTTSEEYLRSMVWGFPEEYDKIYVGTPETVYTPYPTERWLYCKKK